MTTSLAARPHFLRRGGLSRNLVPASILIAVAAIAYLLSHNTEFYRDEDYEYLQLAVAFAHFFQGLPGAITSPDDLIYRIAVFVHSLLFYRHGPLPALYIGGFYALADVIGIPMTTRLYQLPTALIAIGTVLLFWRVLRGAEVRPSLALLGALLLCISPLLVALGRGVHTYTWVWISFGQCFAIWALQRTSPDGRGLALAAFAVLNALLGDGLFFLTLPALLASFGLRSFEWRLSPASLLRAVPEGLKGLRPLCAPSFAVPVVLTLAVIGAAAGVEYVAGSRLQDILPLHSLGLSAFGHVSEGMGFTARLWEWHQNAALAFGEGGLVLLLLAIAGFLFKSTPPHGVAWSFAIIAGVGFGLVFYVAVPHLPEIAQAYQIYTLVPLALLIVLQAERIARMGAVWFRAATSALGAAGLVAIASMLTFVWHFNAAIFPATFGHSDFGPNKPLFGTKAAGYVARQTLLSLISNSPDRVIDVRLYRNAGSPTPVNAYGGFRNWTTPFATFAGLVQKADYFSNKAGQPVEIRTEFVGTDLPVTPQTPACNADLCVLIEPQGAVGGWRESRIVEGARRLAVIRVRLDSGPAPAPEQLEAAVLNARYDREVTRLSDTFADRPVWRRQALSRRLLGN